MQRSPMALVSLAGQVAKPIPMLSRTSPPPPEPFVVVETEKLLVWGGPTGSTKGFQKNIQHAASFLDLPAARRSIGKLKHTTNWYVDVDKLKPLRLSEAAALLATRQSVSKPQPQPQPQSQPQPQPHPQPTIEVKPTMMRFEEGKEPVEVKPPVLVIPAPPAPIETPKAVVKSIPPQSAEVLIRELAALYTDMNTAVAMVEEARAAIERKLGQLLGHANAIMDSLKGTKS